MHLKCHILVLKIFRAVPQSTPTEEASIIIEEPAESASSMATSPGFLTVSSQDASTQCCVGARFVITRSQYTQTDPVVSTPVLQPVKTFRNAGTQVEFISDSPDGVNPGPSSHSSHVKDEKKTNSGVIYPGSLPLDCDKYDKKEQESEENINTANKPKKPTLFEQVYPSDEESPNDPPLSPLVADDDDGNDEEYKCEMTDNAGSSSNDTDDELDCEEHPERKFLVFESCLKLLLQFCSKCGGTIFESTETTSGSMFSVKMLCVNNHLTCWNSQPLIKNIAAGNLLSSAAILFSGNTFSHIAQFASFLNLKFFSHTTFYNIQNKYLFPVVNKAWKEERSSVLNEVKSNGPVSLIGDGRCDSPGHNAKYCTYTMMTDEGKVAAINVVQVTEVTSSNAMEKEGFKRCIQDLAREEVTIKRIATDRHTSISSTMKKDHGEIDHQYDVWHLSKWVIKKLSLKAKVKGCEDLLPWIRSISNHMWWCSATCDGNAQVLKEKWKSVLFHVTNKHKWNGYTHFHECCHPRLTSAQIRKKKWLKPDTPAYIALEEVVLNKKILKDIEKLTEFCHTGELEVYHSEYLKYCPKREHFSHKGMVARAQLTALDHNANCGRKQATVQSGPRAGQARYKVSFPKAQKQWVAKPIKEKKSYEHVMVLMDTVADACETGEVDIEPEARHLPKNISGTPPPSKQELVCKHRSRFNR